MAKKILVVDDEADIRTYLTTLLETHGYETITAADGREALERTRQEAPDLILLDLQMPDQTGTDFYRRLLKQKEFKETPVIIVSGIPGRHLAIREPVAVFDKPIDPEELAAAVAEALGEIGKC
jgi:CheY-like chemotaxis protein